MHGHRERAGSDTGGELYAGADSVPLTTPDVSSVAAAVLEALPDGVLVFAADWRIVLVNHIAEQLFGVPRAELLDRMLGRDLLMTDEARTTVYRAVMRDRQPRPMPGAWLEGAGGARRIFDGEVHPLEGDGIVVVFRDVTRAEQRSAAAAGEAERVQRDALATREVERESLATFSHDVRSPLHAILGYADLLERAPDGGAGLSVAQQRYLQRLRAGAEYVLDLVGGVLEATRPDASTAAAPAPAARPGVLASDAAAAALALVEPQAAEVGVSIVNACVAGAPIRLAADATPVKQILVNLLGNAVKFTPTGGRIIVRCDDAPADVVRRMGLAGGGAWARIAVADTGIGIAPSARDRIFEPYVQLEALPPGARTGTGLGLAISRRLAIRLGGDITVESTVGEGSTFTLWLPALTSAPESGATAEGVGDGADAPA